MNPLLGALGAGLGLGVASVGAPPDGQRMRAAGMGAGAFYGAAVRAGLGTDNATLNEIVALVNNGHEPEAAAAEIARRRGIRPRQAPAGLLGELAAQVVPTPGLLVGLQAANEPPTYLRGY